jgi:4-amino-4-deoxy-L-arabinose transferase and related glycosyltransferases of PMT family
MPRGTLYRMGGIFLLALGVSLLFNLTVAAHYTPTRDSLQYQDIGINFLQDHCYCLRPAVSTIGRAPLWPLLLGLFSLLFGVQSLPVRIFLCVLDASTCVLLYALASRLLGRRAALWVGSIAALYPGLFVYTGWLYSEMLYTFLLVALCYTLVLLQDYWRRRWLLMTGVLLALLALTRPNGLILLVLVGGWLFLLVWLRYRCGGSRGVALIKNVIRHGVGPVVILCCIVGLLILPWAVRNYRVSHSFVPIASGDGTVLLGAYNDASAARPWDGVNWINPLNSAPQLARSFSLYRCDATCEVQREARFKDAAFQWIWQHPAQMPYMLTAHFVGMWLPVVHEADMPMDRFPLQFSSQFVTWQMMIFSIPIFLLALTGMVFLWRRWQQWLLYYLIIVLTIGQGVFFYGSPRFRAPIEPLLILFAVGALACFSQRYRFLLKPWFVHQH